MPTTNVTSAPAQGFVADYELLLPILKTFAQNSRLTLLEMVDVFILCSSRTDCHYHQTQWSSPRYPYSQQSPAPHHSRPLITRSAIYTYSYEYTAIRL